MKKMLLSILVLVMVTVMLSVSGCSTGVEVPPAHLGKLSTKSGLQESVIQPSKLRLTWFCRACPSLILAEASDHSITESMQIFMPNDKLNIKVDVRGIVTVANTASNINKVFAKVRAQKVAGTRTSIIPAVRIYNIYAKPVIRETVRSLLTKYTIAQIMENRDTISAELFKEIRIKLSSTPMTLIRLGLANVQPPALIITAQEKAKEREIAIQQAEADKQVALKEAEAALEVAKKQQQVDLIEAETQLLVNKKLAEGVNEAFIAQRALKVLEKMAGSTNKVFFIPTDAMNNPALILGAVNKGME